MNTRLTQEKRLTTKNTQNTQKINSVLSVPSVVNYFLYLAKICVPKYRECPYSSDYADEEVV